MWSAIYDSFGSCQIETAEIVKNLRYAGQYFDAETGLYYNLNRYYDPTIGRYLRKDPYGDGLILYASVFNNSVNCMDPLGLSAVKEISGGIKVAVKVAVVEGAGAGWYSLKRAGSGMVKLGTDSAQYGYGRYQELKAYLYIEYLNTLDSYKQDLIWVYYKVNTLLKP